ncbi:MAG: hypothetical protein JSW61_06125 [Candidatus Thorarchaeota archaeon]|nr:MAG: hypothetical protein JSW61_06125 [Candidatus Thorarchaeota archaeon]
MNDTNLLDYPRLLISVQPVCYDFDIFYPEFGGPYVGRKANHYGRNVMYQAIALENVTGPFGVILSVLAALFLLRFWFRQEGRILTDLPLMFGITLLATAMNLSVQYLTAMNVLPDTLEVLRIRALLIGGAVIPMEVIMVVIWLQRLSRYHPHILFSTMIYWVVVSLFAPTEALVLGLLIPLLFVFTFAMMATFFVTWKTKRLREVRSDLILLALILIFISQAARLSLAVAGWGFLSDTFNILSATLLSVGLTYNSLRSKILPTETAFADTYAA